MSSSDGPTTNERVKLFFSLEQDEDSYPPVDYESIWAIPLDGDHFAIDNIPFFTCDATLGDVVSAKEVMGELGFAILIKSSGSSLVRALYVEGSDVGKIRASLRDLECSTEWDEIHRLIAIDIPPGADLMRVREFLSSGKEQGIADYEEALIRDIS